MKNLKTLLIGLLLCGGAMTGSVFAAPKPNIIVIMADDLGYGDLGCYGHPTIRTPRLDAMAKAGLKFTDFHSNGAVCSPTRAALLTGRYQQRSGIGGVVTAARHRHTGLAIDEVTFADVLKKNGYATAIYGKWHVGYAPKFNPIHQGFDRFIGFVSGNVDYHSHIDQVGEIDWWKQDKLVPEEGYTTDLITAHGVRFIQQNKDKPFCLYLAHEAPHYPYQGRHDKADRSPGKPKPIKGSRKDKTGAYREMVEVMDEGIGRIVDAVRAAGIEKRTLIFFCSDNGPSPVGSSGGLRGRKGQVWEGGHRVPAIAFWPGTIAAGTVTDQTVLTMDLMPTMVAMAGAKLPENLELDGVNLLPLLQKGNALPERAVGWEFKGNMAYRKGPWKLVRMKRKVFLFHLGKDRNEKQDLSSSEPERLQTMNAELDAWYRSITEGVQSRS
ncbi:MAG: sulfatase-like hydrolase/transferase [Phycisphaeraceae bacterium]|nr:sulfatase-like hydrolase/transferase [Phycisphaeraceae bacterium]